MTDQLDTAAIRAQMEALTDFTPGPWCSSNQPGDWGLAGTNHIHVAGANPYQCDQCITHVEYQTPYCLGEKRSVIEAADQAAANARLIAAAPDMHATILALCDAWDDLRAENERLRGDRDEGAKDYCNLSDQRDALWVENERLRGLLAEAIQWNWIDFEETHTETAEACLPSLVDLNQRIAAALAAMEDHQ